MASSLIHFVVRSILVVLMTDVLSGAQTKGQATLPWVRNISTNRGAIIFVHGVMGDDRSTWSSKNQYWPSMLTLDPAFNGKNIYVYRYPSPAHGRTFSIDEVADNMRLVLDTDGVLRHDELSFVSHSLGGVVTRAFILKYRWVVPKIRLLYFFATPTTGSPYAVLASLVSQNPQFRQLYPMQSDGYLGPLQSNWLAAKLGLRSYCGYETQTMYGQMIVERQSATNLCTERLDPIDADHMTIVKPADQNSTSYRALKAAFEEAGPKTTTRSTVPSPNSKGPKSPPMAPIPNGLTTPSSPPLDLLFTNSPLFTDARKKRIVEDITRFRIFLVNLGLDISTKSPPLSIQGRRTMLSLELMTGGSAIAVFDPYGDKYVAHRYPDVPTMQALTFNQSIEIAPENIDNRQAITSAYGMSAIGIILACVGPDPDDFCVRSRWPIVNYGASYLNNSFWGLSDSPRHTPLELALLEIRNKVGKELTDRLIAYSIRAVGESVSRNREVDETSYFYNRIKDADMVLDNDQSALPTITEIWAKYHLPTSGVYKR